MVVAARQLGTDGDGAAVRPRLRGDDEELRRVEAKKMAAQSTTHASGSGRYCSGEAVAAPATSSSTARTLWLRREAGKKVRKVRLGMG